MPTPLPGRDHDHESTLDLRPGDRPGRFVVEAPPRRGRFGGFLRGLVVGILALVGLLFVASKLVSIDLNPFDAEETDRSQPALLQSIQDLSRFTAAEGNFQQVIDLQDDRKYVPDFLLNQRTLFVAAGSVQAYVDFGDLGAGAVQVSPTDPDAVTVTLPTPRLDDPSLDLDDSYVVSEDRGVLNRIGDAFGDDSDQQGEVYRLAQQKIAQAADDTELLDRAEDNTRGFLTGLLGSLGYTDVTVTFEADPT